MFALLGRKAGEARCCPGVLASCGIFFCFYPLNPFAVKWRRDARGDGGTGWVPCLLLAAERSIKPTPTLLIAIHPSVAKRQGSREVSLVVLPWLFVQPALKGGRKQTPRDARFPSPCYHPKLCQPPTGSIPSRGGAVSPRHPALLFYFYKQRCDLLPACRPAFL